ncbi:hypothetical protein [Clostridium sp.]|uniref:hypothetical protein n=1 Tax=Clostridium sp. TaxID=1506 RepID=UPI0039F5EF84
MEDSSLKRPRVKLDKEEFIKALKAAQEGIKTYSKVETSDETEEDETKETTDEDKPEPKKPVKKSRRSRK